MKKTVFTALYAVFLVAFYQLIVTPLLLDLSYIGLAILIAGTALAFFAVPRPWRRTFSLLSILILLVSYGLMHIFADYLIWKLINLPVMFLLLGWIASSYAGITWRSTLTVFTAVTVLLSVVPLPEMAFYGKLRIEHETEALDLRPIFPVYPLVNQGSTLYTLGDFRKLTDQEIKEAQIDPKERPPLVSAEKQRQQLENVDVLRFLPTEGYEKQLVSKEEMSSLPFPSFGLAGFPYYASSWTIENGAVKQHFTQADSPQTVLTSFLDPLTVTIAMDDRANRSVDTSRKNWENTFGREARPQYPGATLIGKGKFLPDGSTQLLLLGNNEIRLINEASPTDSPIATYKGSWEQPIARNLVIGDIDGDGLDEVMVNSTPAKILKLNRDRNFEQIWESGKRSFRFEFVTKQEGTNQPLIVTQDPSLIRDQETRYLTGYTWQNGELRREWRVFKSSLLFPFPVSDDTWVSGSYGRPRIIVLKPMDMSVPAILTGIYAALVLAGYGCQIVQRRERRNA
ncbi:FG-GAP repeat domain-containing protein [Effusibacillus consociatus]|uniref:FG-GAP repeat domain-containing protein n=1 Tax=Effusibacillus consociatus TaxID=1117041 RepID=A0ABV9Q5Z9_9BACL